MRGSVANEWHAASLEEKRALLRRALASNCPLTTELLDEQPEVLDQLAQPEGLVPVYIATVDAAGLSSPTPGVVSPALAEQYRPRKWRLRPVGEMPVG